MWRGGSMRGIRNVASAIQAIDAPVFPFLSFFLFSMRDGRRVAINNETSEWPVVNNARSWIIRNWWSRIATATSLALTRSRCGAWGLREDDLEPETVNLACDYGVEAKRLALPEVLTRSGSSLRTGIAVAFFFPRKTLFNKSTYSRGIHALSCPRM